MNTVKTLLITFILLASSISASAYELSPFEVVQNTGNTLFSRISSNQQELEKFPELMRTIVDEELMPNVDYRYAAYKVLGKNLKNSTKAQRNKFVDSMRRYLVRTYASVLNQYTNQKVIYEPTKSSTGKKVVAVNLVIVDVNKPDVNIVFKMRKNKKTNEWKAFDLVVEGISLLQSKQSEISRQIASQGIEQVALELASIAK